jgi:hypothetical protein
MLAAFEFKGGRLNFGRSELKHRTKFAGNALRENSIPRLSPHAAITKRRHYRV